ncbi:Alpha/Beta hydrolase protein [Lipomyces oligophaga]|uniref:Alpha/Beta hydrolase protein n=1 Tax=Lipomyces oligophaga TaxID=45792 RepID=UPI0034CDDEB4
MAPFAIADTYAVQGLFVYEYTFSVNLDHNDSGLSASKIKVFARRVVPPDEGDAKNPDKCKRPYIVYLQGGPGFECEPPLSKSGRTKELLDRGYQILYVDQRGTGYSTPISWSTLEDMGSDEERAKYMTYFRADNIVRDCEEIRHILLSNATEKQWSLLGQSFGGFCSFTYLSLFPSSLKDVLITGGVPPLVDSADPVYEALYKRVLKRNKAYFTKFPNDVVRLHEIYAYLSLNKTTLPNGGTLSVERFQQLGLDFGRHQGLDIVHQLVLKTAYDLKTFGKITYNTLSRIEHEQGFDTNVLYACMHEAIYCQGKSSSWSADRMRPQYAEYFDYDQIARANEGDKTIPIYFTGEMIYQSMFDDYIELQPLKRVADILAQKKDWGKLYDEEVLGSGTARVAAVSYFNDMYVDLDLSVEAASKVNNCRQWVTSEFLHNGLTVNPSRVLGRLFKLLECDVE